MRGKKEDADILELDDDGNVIGWGSHQDYDYYALQVMNGEGYYDKNGRYQKYEMSEE